ncbi:PLP-dependent aminotransferase family protein [Streptomyces albus subsp. chlorinus]|nr:PLP-dependent aminotransferase family protein [Streptomyces albus subsp. chlorinus]
MADSWATSGPASQTATTGTSTPPGSAPRRAVAGASGPVPGDASGAAPHDASPVAPGAACGSASRPAGGSDLHLDLGAVAGGGAVRPRAALLAALRDAIRTGRLAPGTRLPSSRTLAADLGLARNTVAAAYAELVAEGWLSARQGSGTRVADRAEPARPGRPRERGAARRVRMPFARAERGQQRPAHDLRTGTPDVSAFPRSAWLTSARRALTAAPALAFSHGDHRGAPELRRALAAYLARARGVRADPERIVVCAGFAQGLALLARVVAGQVAVEEYGLFFHRQLLESGRARTLPLPVDEHGARTGALADDPRFAGVRTVLLTPAHQYPLGVPLHPDRRAAVVDWARRRGGLVLEDDYDGEFRYDRHPVDPTPWELRRQGRADSKRPRPRASEGRCVGGALNGFPSGRGVDAHSARVVRA